MAENQSTQSQADAVRRALEEKPSLEQVKHLMPVIVPSSFVAEGRLPGPFSRLHAPQLALTWAVLFPEAMVYVNQTHASLWEGNALDWRDIAVENLRTFSAKRLWTHEKREGGRLIWAAMMHDDGLGSSRVLLEKELMGAFASGYKIGIPDRSLAVIVPAGLREEQAAEAEQMVAEVFVEATSPTSDLLFDPTDLHVAA